MILEWKPFNVKLDRMFKVLESQLPNFDGMVASVENLQVMFKTDPSDNDLLVVSEYWMSITQQTETTPTLEENKDFVKTMVKSAINFGSTLVTDFATENVMLGITQAGKTKLIADTCQTAFYYLSTGSLYEARAEMLNLTPTEEMSPFLTHARRIAFVNKIEQYLGLPLSS